MNNVGDIGGNLPTGNGYYSKLEKEIRFQIIYTSNISYFLELLLGI